MTFQNPIGFMKRKSFTLTIADQPVTAFQIDLEDLDEVAERYPWFGKQMAGEEVDVDQVPRTDLLRVASSVIAVSLAPDSIGADRAAVEASARNIDPNDRADLMREVLAKSFPQMAASLESAEGNGQTAPKPNRQQRRAVRSKDGGAKPRT